MLTKSDINIPSVSIIMATYNRAHLIGESLKYIVAQSFTNFECLIIDDGSTDSTEEIVLSYTQTDNRFKYLGRPDKYIKGLPGCRNYGLDLAKGEYVVFFDDDDIAHPDNLKTCFSLIRDNKVDFCRYDKRPFSGKWNPGIINEISEFEIKTVSLHQIEEVITGKIAFASCCVLWKKECFENIRFNEELQYAEEWECYSRILLTGFEGVSINQILYYNRKHPNSNTGEFHMNNTVRKNSKIEASKAILENLNRNSVFTESLRKYFIRLAFSLKSYDLLLKTLNYSGFNTLKIWQYKVGYLIYPVLRPILKLKGKLKTA